MECNKDEAIRAKALAERKMLEKDFVGARKMIIKAQQLSSEVDNISQMLTVCDVHCAAGAKVNGQTDWYGILQAPVTADEALIKKQYRKLALLLHPDKNKFAGAEAAFKLVGEANMTLTDLSKRSVYDMKRNTTVRAGAARPPYQQPRRTAPVRANATPVNLHTMHQQQQQDASNSAGSLTFWTICPTCGMRYQYYRTILKKALRCQNCLKPFIAHDLNEQAVPSGANPRSAGVWKNAGAPQQKFPGPQTKVTGQHAQNSATPGVHANTGSQHADGNTKESDGARASAAGGLNDKMKFSKPSGMNMGLHGARPASAKSSKASSTTGSKRSRRAVVESSDSESTDSEEQIIEDGPAANSARTNQQPRRSCRQKQEVKYNEESDDEDLDNDNNDEEEEDFANSTGLKRSRKNGSFHGERSNQRKLNEDDFGDGAPTYGVNCYSNAENNKEGTVPRGEKLSNGSEQMKRETIDAEGQGGEEKEKSPHSACSSNPSPTPEDASNVFSYSDPEFFDFDQLRAVHQFKVNQIWAVYDDQGCMPRFYARITRVNTLKLMLHFTWLEFDPTNKAEEAWSEEDLPVACGNFKVGKSDTAQETHMFSHIISWEKHKTSGTYEIYPRKGEVWALFRGWDIGWSSNAEDHRNFEYEVVQVLSDLSGNTSIIVIPLVKINGFVSLFMQSTNAVPYVIPKDDILRFSHSVPYNLMSGAEREGVPEGAMELDPAALPINLEEAFVSVVPESISMKGQKFDTKCTGLSSGSNSHMRSMGVAERQGAKPPKEENNKHNMRAGLENTDVDDASDIACHPEFECPDSEFYNFTEIRLLQKFETGQIWALYSDVDQFPNYYAFIKKVDFENNKVQIKWLDVCPQGEEDKRLLQEQLPIGCGTFKVLSGPGMSYTGTQSFSHPVHARPTGKRNEYEILPRVGEIWAVYKNWRSGWTLQDFEKCDYELVEIFGRTDSSILVQPLNKVEGYRAVFMLDKKGGTTIIRKDGYPRFSHQIPCFRLTNERGGKLRGFWELDPASVPEEFLITES